MNRKSIVLGLSLAAMLLMGAAAVDDNQSAEAGTTTSGGFNWQAYAGVVLGILISIVLPIIKDWLPKDNDAKRTERLQALFTYDAFWVAAKPYVAIGLFSTITASLVVAYLQINSPGSIENWQSALLAGYLWDSTLQKLK